MESSGYTVEETLIDWAQKKADWYDPTIFRTDEFLGKRDHEQGKELRTEFPWF